MTHHHNTTHTKANNFSLGFTLIELVLVIALIGLAVGVTADVIVSVTRSYSKTQITNEIEQNASFVFAKMEKELRNAKSISVTNSGNSSLIAFTDKNGVSGTYQLITSSKPDLNTLTRILGSSGPVDLFVNGGGAGASVKVECPSGPCFSLVSSAPASDVIKVNLKFSQAGDPDSAIFKGSVSIDDVIVVRGTY